MEKEKISTYINIYGQREKVDAFKELVKPLKPIFTTRTIGDDAKQKSTLYYDGDVINILTAARDVLEAQEIEKMKINRRRKKCKKPHTAENAAQ